MEVSVDGVVKTLTVDYTLSGVGDDAGGNVTMLAAPATSTSVVRRRNMALTRNTDYQDQGELPASTLDSDLDSAVLMIQQVDEKTDRAMVLPTYVSGFSTELPKPIANHFLRVNSAGTALEMTPEITPGALTVTPFIETLLNDSTKADARTTLGAAASGANTDITSLGAVASINGGALAGFRNRIINGNFGVNQRAYVSGAVVGAGLYGHDRWKMDASGDTYTFSTTGNVTTVTIPAGNVLRQVIEGLNLETGTYTLSWVGTAQGKIGAGSYGASGITGVITGGTNTTIEFGPGTVSKVQLEFGSVVTAFEQRPYGGELALCKRYYHVIRGGPGGANYRGVGIGLAHNSVNVTMNFMFPTPMRIGPTISVSTLACYDGSTLVITSSINNYFAGTDSVYMTFIVNPGLVTGRCAEVHTGPASTSFLAFDAEM